MSFREQVSRWMEGANDGVAGDSQESVAAGLRRAPSFQKL